MKKNHSTNRYHNTSKVNKILVLRFSAMGDVAMTVPVVYALAQAHPELEITVVSRDFFAPLYEFAPHNVRFWGIDMREYGSIGKLGKLYAELRRENFDTIADLHDVLRTKYLRLRFRLAGRKVAVIDKGRAQKRRLTRARNKCLCPLPTSFERYAQVFRHFGLTLKMDAFTSVIPPRLDIPTSVPLMATARRKRFWIGVAPFAKHAGKTYPPGLMEQVVRVLAARRDTCIFLYGGKEDIPALQAWSQRYPNTVLCAGNQSLRQDLLSMSCLDVMISMDSANMHLASLVGTPVVSIWGATHPFAGFLGWKQSEENAVQADLPCRPCSVFGNKPCRRDDYACLHHITPEMIVEKVEKFLVK